MIIGIDGPRAMSEWQVECLMAGLEMAAYRRRVSAVFVHLRRDRTIGSLRIELAR